MNKKLSMSLSVFLVFLFLLILGNTKVLAAEEDVYLKSTNSVKYTAEELTEEYRSNRNHVKTLPELFQIEVSGRLYEMTAAFKAYQTAEIGKNHWKHILILPDAEALVENAEASLIQADVDAARNLINDLTIESDKEDLQDRLVAIQAEIYLQAAKSATELEEENKYTAASWEILTNALALPEDTVKEKDIKTNAIYEAIDQLVEKATGQELTVIGYYGTYDANPYSVEIENLIAEDKAEYSTDGGATWTSEKPTFTDAGNYTVFVKVTNPDYTDRQATGTVNIAPKKVSITADQISKVYTGSDQTLTGYDVSGLLEGHILSGIEASGTGKNVGEYDVTFTGSPLIKAGELDVTKNYTTTLVPGKLTIAKATYNLDDIAFADAAYIYDGTAKNLSISGSLPEGVTVNFENNGQINADIYTVTAKFNGDADNYEAIPDKTATLTINKAPLTITADEKTSVYGEDLKELTCTLDGTIYNDDNLNISLNKTDGDIAGDYEITVSAANSNYELILVNGTYTIEKATYNLDEISFEDATYTYDGTAKNLEIAGELPTGVSVTYEGNEQVNAGEYEVTALFIGDTDNYEAIEDKTAVLTINKIELEVVANSDTRTYNGSEQTLEGYIDPLDLLDGHALSGITASGSGTDAGEYDVAFDDETAVIMAGDVDVTENYAITLTPGILTIEKAELTAGKIKINEDSFDLTKPKTVERDYTDNSIKAAVFSGDTAPAGKILEKISLISIIEEIETDITDQFTFKFYTDADKENEITELGLSKGGSTYKLYIDATDESGNYNLSTQVIFKYKSVTRGATSTTYYTIEDALKEFSSGTVIVKHNTSFADADVAQEVYGGTRFEVKENVTLLLPHGYTYVDAEGVTKTNKYSTSITDKFENNGTQAEITKNSSYVELFMPEGISLDVNGTLTVNAIRSGGTPTAGQIVGSNYSQIQMLENSKITVNSGGKVNSIGFVYGHGSMEAKDGSTVIDSLIVTAFRGGNKTTIIYEQVFPFDQFSFHNIEVPLTINSGANYDLSAIFSAAGEYVNTEAPLIGKNDSANPSLISIGDGKIVKSYQPSTGKVTLDFYSTSAQINDLTLYIVGYNASTVDKEMPFPGNFQLNVKSGSTITMNAGAKLLPGSGLYIEQGATAIITENGRLVVFDAGEYIDLTRGYPQNAKKYFRVEPAYDYSTTTPANCIIDGTLIVEGGIAGKVQTNTGGVIQIASTASTQLEINNMDIINYGVVPSIYNLKDKNGKEIHAVGSYRILTDNSWVTDITFYKNDGSGAEETITQTYGENYLFPEWADESITWYSKPSGGEALTCNKVNIVWQDLYARKEITKHAITFDTNGGQPINIYLIPTSSKIDLNKNFTPVKEGSIFLGWYTDEKISTRFDSSYVFESDLTVYARWAKGSIKITLTPEKTEIEKEETINVTAKFEDDNGPLENLEIEFINTMGSWEDGRFGITNNEGIVTKTFTSEHKVTMGFNMNDTISVREIFTGTQESVKINVEAACPLIYSYDGENYYLEHEPVPYSVNKALETTSHGTLRKLAEVDGKYHIKITEEMYSQTFVNGVCLYVVDYLDANGIKEIFVDIFGNPHTIKGRAAPKAFTDSKGQNYLDIVATEGQLLTSDIYAMEQGDYLESYIAVFERPEAAGDMAKFMISVKANPIVDAIAKWFYDILDGQNNIWWLENILQLSPHFEQFIEAMGISALQIDLWDGSEWINQGAIAAGSNLLEEFLIPLDLSLISDQTQDVKVRIRGGAGFFTIDQVSIDFSQDGAIKIQRLNLDSALKNGADEVGHIVDDLENNQRVSLKTGDYIDFYYDVPEVEEGFERGFIVDFKGYFHVIPQANENPVVDSWADMDYEAMLEAVLAEQPEAADILLRLEELFDLAEEVVGQSLEYKFEKIIGGHLIPWLRGD